MEDRARERVFDRLGDVGSPGDSVDAMATICTHLDQVEVVEVPSEVAGCEDCLREGSTWVHLRMCQTCGGIRCCDNSPKRHATAHFHAAQHPIIHSAQPGESWSFCYEDEVAFVIR